MATANDRRPDQDVMERFKQPAAANHRSLESEVRHPLSAAEDQKVEREKSFGELAARLRHRTLDRDQTPSEILIRKDRDDGHRVVGPG